MWRKHAPTLWCRIERMFDRQSGIDCDWVGLKSFVQVDRIGMRQGKPYQQNSYGRHFLIHLFEFAQSIRGHWGIENRLHWVKDVVFKEDTLPLKHHNAASNLSLIRNIVINVARQNGYASLTKAERFLSHNIDLLISLIE